MNRRSGLAARVGLMIAVCFAAPAKGAEDNVWAEFEIAKNGDFILIPVTIADQTYQFIVDTASTVCVVDTALRFHLHDAGRKVTLNRNELADVYLLPEARLGNLVIPSSTESLCRDLAAFRLATGHDVRGVLGMNCLESHILQVDFDAGKLSFLKRCPDSTIAGHRLSYSAANIPMLDVELPAGDVIAFRIDTGMTGASNIEHDTFLKLRADGMLNDDSESILNHRVSLTFHGLKLERAAVLKQMRFGDLVHKNVRVRDGASNILGLRILSRYLLTLDFPNDRLFLEKRKRSQEKQPPATSQPTPSHGSGTVIAE